MPEDNQIVEFYISEKLSETQVAARLSIAPKHVRRVLNRHKVSRRTRSEAIRYLYITKFNKKPFDLKKDLSKKEQTLKIAGVMLYWGEGSKRVCELVNSDGKMIKCYLSILRNVFNIPEGHISPTLRIFSGMNRKECLNYWSNITGILKKRFIIRLNDGGTRGRTKYGMCRIIIRKGSNTLKLIHSLIEQTFGEVIDNFII